MKKYQDESSLKMTNMRASTFVSCCFICVCVLTIQVDDTHAESVGSPFVHSEQLKLPSSRDLQRSRDFHHIHKRGFRSGVADRIAHGFGKRKMSVYTGVNRLADLLNTGYREDDLPATKIGMPVIQLAKQFHDDQNTLVDYLSDFIDINGDGFLESSELFGEQFVPDIKRR